MAEDRTISEGNNNNIDTGVVAAGNVAETGVVAAAGSAGVTGDMAAVNSAGIGVVGGSLSRTERKALTKASRAEKKTRRPGVRRKRKKGWIFFVVILVAVVGYFVYSSTFGAVVIPPQVRFTELSRGELRNTVSVNGNVQSTLKRSVYSSLGFTVKSVEVEVGDSVEEGQVLCLLDTENLELNIAQSNADLRMAQENAENQIESSQKVYDDAARDLAGGTNGQILNAEASLRSAGISLENAQTNYNNLLRDSRQGSGAARTSAESALVTAKNDLDDRARDLETNKKLFEAGAVSQETLTLAETAWNASQNRYNDALTGVENAKTAEARNLEQAANALKTAQTAYSNAQTALSSAQRGAEQELERYGTNVETSKISANVESRQIAIQILEKQLADSKVTSPVAGVVTAVYAKEGNAGTGLLFVVEDPSALMVKTKVKEYDTGKLATGMPVVIQSDAVADVEYAGTLNKIEPAAIKNQLGETDTTADVEFGAEVSVDTPDSLLKIGMNARLDIILESRADVFSVPYDSVLTNAAGQSVVYAIEDGAEGTLVAREVPVEIGLDTDFYVEIIGDGLTDGLRIISYLEGIEIYDGAPVSLPPAGGTGGAAPAFGVMVG